MIGNSRRDYWIDITGAVAIDVFGSAWEVRGATGKVIAAALPGEAEERLRAENTELQKERDLYKKYYAAAVAALEPLQNTQLAAEIGLEWGAPLTTEGVQHLLADREKLLARVAMLEAGLQQIGEIVATPPGMETTK